MANEYCVCLLSGISRVSDFSVIDVNRRGKRRWVSLSDLRPYLSEKNIFPLSSAFAARWPEDISKIARRSRSLRPATFNDSCLSVKQSIR